MQHCPSAREASSCLMTMMRTRRRQHTKHQLIGMAEVLTRVRGRADSAVSLRSRQIGATAALPGTASPVIHAAGRKIATRRPCLKMAWTSRLVVAPPSQRRLAANRAVMLLEAAWQLLRLHPATAASLQPTRQTGKTTEATARRSRCMTCIREAKSMTRRIAQAMGASQHRAAGMTPQPMTAERSCGAIRQLMGCTMTICRCHWAPLPRCQLMVLASWIGRRRFLPVQRT